MKKISKEITLQNNHRKESFLSQLRELFCLRSDRWIIFFCVNLICVGEWKEFHQKKVPNTTLKKHLKMMKSFGFFSWIALKDLKQNSFLERKHKMEHHIVCSECQRVLVFFVVFQERIISTVGGFSHTLIGHHHVGDTICFHESHWYFTRSSSFFKRICMFHHKIWTVISFMKQGIHLFIFKQHWNLWKEKKEKNKPQILISSKTQVMNLHIM